MNADGIISVNMATVDILRQDKEDAQAFKTRVKEAKEKAKLKGGKILRGRGFSNDYFLEVFFTTKKAKEDWLTFIKAKEMD